MGENRIRSFAILLSFLSTTICYSQSLCELPECCTTRDSVFVRSTQWPSVEIDELILCHNGEATTVYYIYTADGSSLEFLFTFHDHPEVYDCFEVYNAAADGSSYLFYNRTTSRLYITYGIYAEFDPVAESVDFSKQQALLKNRHSVQFSKDTLDIGRETGYIISKNDIIRVEFKEINTKQDSSAD